MNQNTYAQPLTDADQNAMATALANPTSTTASKVAALKMMYTIATNAATFGITAGDMMTALSEGMAGAGDTAMFETLAFEYGYIGPWGVLIVQAAGVIQLVTWAEELASWFIAFIKKLAGISSIAEAGTAMMSGHPLDALMDLLGMSTSSTTTSDRRLRDGSLPAGTAFSSIMLMSASEAPTFSMITGLLNQALPGGSSGSMNGSGAGGGASGAPYSPSPSQSWVGRGAPRRQRASFSGAGPSQAGSRGGGMIRSVSATNRTTTNNTRSMQQGGGGGSKGGGGSNGGSGNGAGSTPNQNQNYGYTPNGNTPTGQTPLGSTVASGNTPGGSGGSGNTGASGSPGGSGGASGGGSGGSGSSDARIGRRRDAGINSSRKFIRVGGWR